jgi:hypothetical protein
MENLVKLRERTAQTQVKDVRHIFSTIQLLKSWKIKDSNNRSTFKPQMMFL